jgi:hypothetical protein
MSPNKDKTTTPPKGEDIRFKYKIFCKYIFSTIELEEEINEFLSDINPDDIDSIHDHRTESNVIITIRYFDHGKTT